MAFDGKKVAQIKAEDVMKDAVENKHVKWLKAKAAEIAKKEEKPMKAFFQLRKAYLAEYYPAMLERKKKPAKKGKSLFERIAEMEG